MHGFILVELKRFIEANSSAPMWTAVWQASGLHERIFLPATAYPDHEFTELLGAAAVQAGKPATSLLEEFGAFLVPDLVRLYSPLIDRRWHTLDVIEHTEAAIHQVVRLRSPEAKPPELSCTRTSPDQVRIVYRSARRMCAMARGIVRGLAEHYTERVEVSEPACMLTGADACEIRVRLL